MQIKPLRRQDFGALWTLAEEGGHLDVYEGLTPDRNQAAASYKLALSTKRSLMLGAFHGEQLVGAVCVVSNPNPFHRKDHANVLVWIGPMVLLEHAKAWMRDRPAIRMLGLIFDRRVAYGLPRLLRMHGFVRQGDVYYYWG